MPPVVGAVLLPNLGTIIDCAFFRANSDWLDKLKEPSCKLPPKVYDVLRISTSAGLGFASYVVFKEHGFTETTKIPLIVYGSNLVFNWAHPILLKGCHNLKLAYVDLALAAITGAATGHLFFNLNKCAGLMCIPFVLFVTYSSVYTYKLQELNSE